MNPRLASMRLWEIINAFDDRVETGYDLMRVKNARAALNYLENWCIPLNKQEKENES